MTGNEFEELMLFRLKPQELVDAFQKGRLSKGQSGEKCGNTVHEHIICMINGHDVSALEDRKCFISCFCAKEGKGYRLWATGEAVVFIYSGSCSLNGYRDTQEPIRLAPEPVPHSSVPTGSAD